VDLLALAQLGLECRHKVKTLHELLATDDDTPANGDGALKGKQAND
jgi:hypothetical protein